VSFAEPRTVTAVHQGHDTLRFSDTRALFGTVRAGSTDTLFIALTSVLTGSGEASVPIATTSTIQLNAGATVQVIATRPGAIELTVLAAIVISVATLMVIAWAWGQGAS
jgi:hypothetical protein